jgi:hypothetical protein
MFVEFQLQVVQQVVLRRLPWKVPASCSICLILKVWVEVEQLEQLDKEKAPLE